MEEVAKFYALNFGKLLGAALVVRGEGEENEGQQND
jgi:hypothetical protein